MKKTSFLVSLTLLFLYIFLPSNLNAATLPADFIEEVVAEGFDTPTDAAIAPDGRIFVTEKKGTVRIIDNGHVLAQPFIDLINEVHNAHDQGLLGITLHPNFEQNGYVYLLYVVDPIFGQPDEHSEEISYGRLTRYTANGNNANLSSRKVILGATADDGFPSCHNSHAIGTVRFGEDGSLFVGAGDGAHYNFVDGGQNQTNFDSGCEEVFGNAQDFGAFRSQQNFSLAGKIVRIDPETGGGLPGNPNYTGDPSDHDSRMWVEGLRNPFRYTVRPGSSGPGSLYIADVGWNDWEELNVASIGGENFGWPCYEGNSEQSRYQNHSIVGPLCGEISSNEVTQPAITWHHSNSNPIGFTGRAAGPLAFYTGDSFPAKYRNALFFADFPSSWMRVARFDTNDQLIDFETFGSNMDFPVDIEYEPNSDGLIYVSIATGEVRRIKHTTSNSAPVAVASSNITAGAAPLTVDFSSDGTSDPDDDPIELDWDFGDGSDHSSEANPTHTYETPGNYVATLAVTDSNDNFDQDSINIDARNEPPELTITSPTHFYAFDNINGEEIELQADAFDRVDGTNLDYTWQVDLIHANHIHPQLLISNDESPNFFFDNHGDDRISYIVGLTVTDSDGLSASDSVRVIPIEPGPNENPIANFNASPKNGQSPLLVSFNAEDSSDPDFDLLFYDWDFGDGNTGEGVTTTHIYENLGSSTVTLTVTDVLGASDTATTEITVEEHGLVGEYFNNIDLTNHAFTRVDPTINFNWHTGSPDPVIGVNTFSIRWTGFVEPEFTELYNFYTRTDDGVRLWVNDQLIVDKWVDQSSTEWSGSINLIAGQKYSVKMEYFENGTYARAGLSWSSPSQAKEIIPQDRLFQSNNQVNQPPVANAGEDRQVIDQNNDGSQTVTLNGSESFDPDGDIVNYLWRDGESIISDGPNAAVDVSLLLGTHTLTLEVTDDEDAVAFDTVTITVSETGGVNPLPYSANFNADDNGFTYQDDSFRGSNQPTYASGTYLPNGGFSGGGLRILLGGINGDDIFHMSGGWKQRFTVNTAGEVTLTFRYNLTQASFYEADEVSQMLVSVNGVLKGVDGNEYIVQIRGDGDTGGLISTGWQQVSLNLGTLNPGIHEIIIGGYNNKKTYTNETTSVLIDDVTLTTSGAPVNQAPNVNAGDDDNVTLPDVTNLNPTVNDDGLPNPPGALTYQWSQDSGPGTVNFANATSKNTTASFSDPGTYVLRLTVDDGELSASDTVTITVNESGDGSNPLPFNANFNTNENGFTYEDDTFQGSNQPAYASGTYLANGGFSGGGLRVLLGGINGDDIFNMTGGWKQNFTVNTAGEVTLIFRYNLTQAAFYEADELSRVLVSVDGTLKGLGGNTYIDQIVGDGDTGPIMTTGWKQVSVNLGTLSTGSHEIIIGGYNNKKTFTNETTTVLIDDVSIAQTGTPTNEAPTVNAGPNLSSTVNEEVHIEGEVTDDGLPNPPGAVTIQWTLVNGPDTPSWPLNDQDEAHTHVTFPTAGTYVLELTADDGQQQSSDTVTINVNNVANELPTANAGADQTVTDSNNDGFESITLNASVSSDPDGNITNYRWSEGTTELANSSNPTANVNFAIGQHTVTLEVTDNLGATATDTVVITINAPAPINQAPSVNAGSDRTVFVNQELQIEGEVSDDGLPNPPGALTIQWTLVSGPDTPSWPQNDQDQAQTHVVFPTAGTYVLQLSASDDELSANDTVTVTVNNIPGGGGNGLLGSYYDNINFTNLALTRTDPVVDFDWDHDAPDPSMEEETFSIVWTGSVEAEFTEEYTFYTVSDDGARLWVNGQLLIEEWIDQYPTEYGATIPLNAGVKYDIRFEFYENGGGAVAKLLWSSPSQSKQIIPTDRLFSAGSGNSLPIADAGPNQTVVDSDNNGEETITLNGSASSDVEGPITNYRWTEGGTELANGPNASVSVNFAVGLHNVTLEVTDQSGAIDTDSVIIIVNPPSQSDTQGLLGQYYDNIDFTNLALTRVDPVVNFNWDHDAPDPSMEEETFSIRWTGKIIPLYTETYTIYTVSDDGARLWVDGQFLIDEWFDQYPTEYGATISLEAGVPYDIVFEFYENGGGAAAELLWSSPSQAKEIIPESQLMH